MSVEQNKTVVEVVTRAALSDLSDKDLEAVTGGKQPQKKPQPV